MSRLSVVVILLLVASVSWAAPANPAAAVPDDDIFRSIRRLALLAGQSPPSAVSPLAYGELEAVLRRMDTDSFSEDQIEEYLRALDQVVVPPAVGPRGTIGLDSTFEGYLHSADLPGEWRYWYPDRRSMLVVPISVSPVSGLGLSIDFDWRRNYPVFPGSEDVHLTINSDPVSNVLIDVGETDIQFPFHAMLTATGSGWSVQAGRSRIGWGLGHTGSLMLSDHVDYHDFAMASLYGGLLSYRTLYLDLEPWVTGGGAPDRVYLAHRLEFRPAPWLTLTANEAIMFRADTVELRYLNPLMVLHSWFTGNTMINLEAAVRPLRGLEVWGHLAIDQFQSAVEKERDAASGRWWPEALGYLAGAEYVLPLSDTWLTVAAEFAYLDPWMYIGRNAYNGYNYFRRVQAEHLVSWAQVLVEKSLGYPEGQDYVGVTGFARLDLGTDISVQLELSYSSKGDNGFDRLYPADDEADRDRVTPSGLAPTNEFAARVAADWHLLDTELWGAPLRITGGGILDLVRAENHQHVSGAIFSDVQFSPYVTISTVFGE